MTRSREFADLVCDQFNRILGEAALRRMFGGWGVFHQGLMIALIADDEIFMKVDEQTRTAYADAGSQPFTYIRAGKDAVLRSYWRLPDGLLDDLDGVAPWAVGACDAALRSAKEKTRKGRGWRPLTVLPASTW